MFSLKPLVDDVFLLLSGFGSFFSLKHTCEFMWVQCLQTVWVISLLLGGGLMSSRELWVGSGVCETPQFRPMFALCPGLDLHAHLFPGSASFKP